MGGDRRTCGHDLMPVGGVRNVFTSLCWLEGSASGFPRLRESPSFIFALPQPQPRPAHTKSTPAIRTFLLKASGIGDYGDAVQCLRDGHVPFRGLDLGVPPRPYFRSFLPALRSPCWRRLHESQQILPNRASENFIDNAPPRSAIATAARSTIKRHPSDCNNLLN